MRTSLVMVILPTSEGGCRSTTSVTSSPILSKV